MINENVYLGELEINENVCLGELEINEEEEGSGDIIPKGRQIPIARLAGKLKEL